MPAEPKKSKYPGMRRAMLKAGTFHLDGWTSGRGREEAVLMQEQGLLTIIQRVSDEQQYTCLDCTVTEAGKEELMRIESERGDGWKN